MQLVRVECKQIIDIYIYMCTLPHSHLIGINLKFINTYNNLISTLMVYARAYFAYDEIIIDIYAPSPTHTATYRYASRPDTRALHRPTRALRLTRYKRSNFLPTPCSGK